MPFHLWPMHIPGFNRIDNRLALRPRDYIAPSSAFGVDADAKVAVPPGGTLAAAKVAYSQHRYVLAWRAGPARPSGAGLGRDYGFSKQAWSRAILGESWMGQTLLAALLDALAQRRGRTGQRCLMTHSGRPNGRAGIDPLDI